MNSNENKAKKRNCKYSNEDERTKMKRNTVFKLM